MTVEEYISAIKEATTSDEVLTLWSRVASEREMTLHDIISVHRSCGEIVTDAALADQSFVPRERGKRLEKLLKK